MIRCTNCGTNNLDTSNFCDECGTRLAKPAEQPVETQAPPYVPPSTDPVVSIGSASEPFKQPAQVTSLDVPPIEDVEPLPAAPEANGNSASGSATTMDAKLILERGEGGNIEFPLVGTEATIGRWDADNGVFPDVDLDQYDGEAKVSRRHARIKLLDGRYVVEDLGSTNGTYINRGRRLLPGSPQAIENNDEVIVGKTFLRFRLNG